MNKQEKGLLDSLIFGKLSKLDEATKRAVMETMSITSSKAKWSINGALIGVGLAELDKKDNELIVFSGQDLKTRKFPVADIQTASQMVEMKQFYGNGNATTGTRFVQINGKVYGENLVILAKSAGLI